MNRLALQALIAFGLSLIAYTLQTEAAQYVQQGLGYRKPFLSLYLGHSGFSLLLPAHLLFLRWHTGQPLSHHLHLIAQNLHWQLRSPMRTVKEGHVQQGIRRRLSSVSGRRDSAEQSSAPSSRKLYGDDGDEETGQERTQPPRRPLQRSVSWRDSVRLPDGSRPLGPQYRTYSEHRLGFDLPRFVLLLLVLMTAITVPALSWYCAVPMTSMADITALYNTFSVWALVFSVWFLGDKWSRYKVASVLLACGGVIIVAYGGAEHRQKPKELDPVYGKPPSTSSSTIAASSTSQSVITPSSTMTATMATPTMTAVTEAAVRTVIDAVLSRAEDGGEQGSQGPAGPSNPLLGDLLALFGAVTMAAYEMAFKLLGTLPDEDVQRQRWDAVQASGRTSSGPRASNGRRGEYTSVAAQEEDDRQRLLDGDEPSQHVIGGADDDDAVDAGGSAATIPTRTSLPVPPDGLGHLTHLRDERSAIWDSETAAASGYGSNGHASPSLPGYRGSSEQQQPDAGVISERIAAVDFEDENRIDPSKGSKNRRGQYEGRASVTVKPVVGSSASSSADGDDGEEQESIVDEADAEEIRGGSTRLGRPKSYHSAKSAVRRPIQDASYEDEDVDEDEQLKSELTSIGIGHGASSAAAEWIPPPLPFGLHANIMTAGIGLVTLSTLWVGVLVAHLAGWETFEWPHNWLTVFAILFVVMAGVVFNGCFMVLLAIWGPVTASVSCLLSTVAVALLDAVLGSPFSVASALGCFFILGGFGLLLLEPNGGH